MKPAEAPRGPDARHHDIKSFQRGDRIEGVYLLSKLDIRKTKHGDEFFAFDLTDRSGTIPGRLWEIEGASFAELREAPVVYVTGVVDEWMNELQLKTISMEAVEASLEELRILLPHTPFDVDELLAEVKQTFQTLDSPHLRLMFARLLEDDDFVARLKEAPAASSYHHNYIGGLLEHIVSLLRVSEQVLGAYTRLNRDLVLAGAFLHDIGKVEELAWRQGFVYTTRGQMLGHIAIGTLFIEEWTRKIDDFPPELKDELIHLILSHHGIREHGSPVLPLTPEAMVVHFLDNLDGKLWSAWTAIDDAKSGTEEWSPYSRHLRRAFYRRGRVGPEAGPGEAAPEEAAADAAAPTEPAPTPRLTQESADGARAKPRTRSRPAASLFHFADE